MQTKGRTQDTTPGANFDPNVGIGSLSRDLYRAMCRAIDARVAGYGLTSQTCRYLTIIRSTGGATAKELSDYLSVRSPTTLAALRLLEDKRLIKRTNDPADGRKGIYLLTARGAEVEAIVFESATEVERRATRGLTQQERRLFKRIAQLMHESIREDLHEIGAADERPRPRRRAKKA